MAGTSDLSLDVSSHSPVWLQLVAAEERCALAETDIRQEVSTEMASLLHDMEANYKVCHHADALHRLILHSTSVSASAVAAVSVHDCQVSHTAVI